MNNGPWMRNSDVVLQMLSSTQFHWFLDLLTIIKDIQTWSPTLKLLFLFFFVGLALN